jgi:alkylation response protein AidB-like acyl-CoA dehydrogenase
VWCQGFSETEAGSDLAAVRTAARRVDGGFVVDGAKIWTSGAADADWIYLLVRTGTREERHRGLSFLIAPMTSPGITTRPIEQITGNSEFGAVTLEGVHVPDENRLGAVGEGWTVAMTLLAAERLSGRHRYGLFRHELAELATMIAGRSTPRADALRDLGQRVAEIEGMGALARRAESMLAAGVDPGPLPSINKVWWPIAHQKLVEAGLLRSGPAGADPAVWYRRWLDARPESIYGGAAQIQRNIIAERFLGLPR